MQFGIKALREQMIGEVVTEEMQFHNKNTDLKELGNSGNCNIKQERTS